VDYVQLIKSCTARRERYLEIGDITKTLKQLARELDNHVIAASQLNRQAEETMPTLRDLKESGAQEEDADNVLFIHRGREVPAGKEVVEAEIIVAKQRNGPTGKLLLGWMPKRVTFVPYRKGVN
jgi:replicative DNA helicase